MTKFTQPILAIEEAEYLADFYQSSHVLIAHGKSIKVIDEREAKREHKILERVHPRRKDPETN